MRIPLTEALCLAFLGGAAGLLLAAWGMDLLTSLRPERLRGFWSDYARAVDPESVRMSGIVALFGLGMSVLTGLAFGLIPALHGTRIDAAEAMRSAAGVARGRWSVSPRAALIVTQMALAIVLVAGAALVVTSFSRLLATSIGARSEALLTFRLDLPQTRYDREDTRAFHDRLLAGLEALPGVREAATANALPVSGLMEMTVAAPAPEEVREPIGVIVVSAGWFETFGVSPREGRLPTPAEHAAAAPVAVLNETAARRFFPDGRAIGGRLRLALGVVAEVEIVGVVADVRYEAVEDPPGADVYIGSSVYPRGSAYVVLHTIGDPGALLEPAREMIRTLDPQLPIYDVRTMRERVAGALSRTRFAALLMATFAALALANAAVGIYGVASYEARARTREIAIRMAVGAGGGSVLRVVLGDALRKALIALLIGVPAALAASRLLRAMLFEITPHDPLTMTGVAAGIIAVSLLASWLPARRAARTDPMQVLRHE
jgi:predicted permease